MRILLATNYQPPHTGGIQYAAESLKRCWRDEGHEVTWLSTDIPPGGRDSTEDNIRLPATNFLERWQCYTPV
ncbi:MAG: glycosyltransferase family 4 protein, partial [Akkermansiaceae bacterium]|nr:glycosyltransferase family 4 protein [Akkermansiaceae bacterium]